MNGRRIIITTAAALALVAGGTAAGAAIAGGPVDSSGVIHGCWTNTAINGSHAFILQDAGTSCPSGTTAISWNAQGPAGPPGAAGAQGPAGPQGPAGTGITSQDALNHALNGTACNEGQGTISLIYAGNVPGTNLGRAPRSGGKMIKLNTHTRHT